jgi:hypothetical protein
MVVVMLRVTSTGHTKKNGLWSGAALHLENVFSVAECSPCVVITSSNANWPPIYALFISHLNMFTAVITEWIGNLVNVVVMVMLN